jgi:hypothetical protein
MNDALPKILEPYAKRKVGAIVREEGEAFSALVEVLTEHRKHWSLRDWNTLLDALESEQRTLAAWWPDRAPVEDYLS